MNSCDAEVQDWEHMAGVKWQLVETELGKPVTFEFVPNVCLD